MSIYDPIVIKGPEFNWKLGKKCMDNVINKNGEVNWGAALNADPGIAQCPTCQTYFWKAAQHLKCTKCSTEWEAW